jgi:methyl-accepting chemotaxis protein WspA
VKNWKIGTRILVGFSTVIAIALALGLFAFTAVIGINKSSNEVTSNALPGVYGMGQIRGNVGMGLAFTLQRVLVADNQEALRLEDDLRTLRARNGDVVKQYDKLALSNRNRELFDELKAARKNFWDCVDEILAIVRTGKPDAKARSLDLVHVKLTPLFVTYRKAAETLVALNEDIAADAKKSIEGSVGSARSGILLGLAAALLLAALISFFVAHGIMQPLAIAVELVDQVAQGDLEIQR